MVTVFFVVNENSLRVNVMNTFPFCNGGYRSDKQNFNDIIPHYLKMALEGTLER